MSAYWHPLLGGMVLGTSAVLLLLANGRIAGISGIVGRLLQGQRLFENAAFLIGLVLGPVFYALVFGTLPSVTIVASWPVTVMAGLLVGFGTRMGSGCTSGHGILGLARVSPRSIAATAAFLAAGILTATVMGAFR
ncbi:YeeE/YedE family protein [Mesorhizobium sp. DCY119]|uniref:YeeE/YedE family protein n=1 Tax=Mesorhizobium sp. DCY119 TaxID=2108445 RepID=UPI000E6C168B|nr:YeeE/YedE family protein [Mesorhizobium sp. DCY119]RJG46184.1 YeeE/YedE family protein [Mesorhizobium sp. DCY119]